MLWIVTRFKVTSALPMFALFPFLPGQFGFSGALGGSMAVSVPCFGLASAVLQNFGIRCCKRKELRRERGLAATSLPRLLETFRVFAMATPALPRRLPKSN